MAVEILIRLTALGDVLLAIPAARSLAENGVEVHWVLSERWEGISTLLPVKKVQIVRKSTNILNLSRQLRNLKPVRVYDLQGKMVSRVLTRLIGVPANRFHKRTWTESIEVVLGQYPLKITSKPVWKKYLDAVGAVNIIPDARLNLSDDYLSFCENWLFEHLKTPGKEMILLHPGASKPGKLLPPDACKQIVASITSPVVVIGDTPTPLSFEPFIDLRGRIPLEILPGFMALSRGLITTDSGPMHLGRAVDCPTAGIFIQTDPSLGFSPIPGPKVKVFSKNCKCKPCSLHGGREVCPDGTWECRNLDWKAITDEIVHFFDFQS